MNQSLDTLTPSQLVLATTERVVAAAEHVRVVSDPVALDRAAHTILAGLRKQRFSPATWRTHPLHPSVADDAAAEFIFFLDLMNFSFWHDDDTKPYTVAYQGKRYTGYWSLCAAIMRALDEGVRITEAKVMRDVSEETLRRVFRGETDTQISLFDERLKAIREAGDVLMTRFNGSFVNLIREANGSVQSLMRLVLEHFPTFRDETTYRGERVAIYKRLQILPGDVWACFEGAGLGAFRDIDSLTMLADYRVPQALVHLGLLEYSPALLARLQDPAHRLASGDPVEVEIRAGSVWAVEVVRRRIVEMIEEGEKAPTAVLLDFFLWDYAKTHPEDMAHIPIHRTRGIFY
ncbi:hypothetical protein H9P43_003872 [Blastocladiella emersonii ATCC 22665]|nr:hypothetical protein H9P43_003872 [Blastocladiella emersonii ATCC 22665]